MKLTEEQLEFMRKDIDSNFAISKIIDKAKNLIEADGKNFMQEFEFDLRNRPAKKE